MMTVSKALGWPLVIRGFVRLSAIAICLLPVSGCINDDTTDLRQYINGINSRPKTPVKPLPEIKVVETFIFQPEGLRDPFQPIAMVEGYEGLGGDGLRPDNSRRKEELEAYALDTLKMVGTIAMDSLWGLVMVGDGSEAIHRVRVGNYMGRNNGKIIQITENSIELMEIVPDQNKSGAWLEQQASLVLTE